MPLSFSEWALASLILILGAVIQGSVGFGVALLGAPLLYFLNPFLVPGPMLIAGMTLPFLILLREGKALDLQGLRWALPGQFAGSALAAIVVASVSEGNLTLGFGLLVLLAVGLSIGGAAPSPTAENLIMAGSLSGFMATATSIGGPPLALVYQGTSGPRLRATLSSIFVPGGFASLTALALVGRFGITELKAGLVLLPAVLVGFALSSWTVKALDWGWLRETVLGVSALAGAGAIARGLM